MNVLTDEHRRAIAAVPDFDITPQGWMALEEAITLFQVFHPRRRPIAAQRELWQRIRDTSKKQQANMWALMRQTHWGADDPLWPDRFLAANLEAQRKAEAHLAYYDLRGPDFRGKDPDRAELYWRIMKVWTDHGGEIGRSTTAGRAVGPLIRFMQAVVQPILGDKTPTAEGFAKIIRRERERRQTWPSKRKRKFKKAI